MFNKNTAVATAMCSLFFGTASAHAATDTTTITSVFNSTSKTTTTMTVDEVRAKETEGFTVLEFRDKDGIKSSKGCKGMPVGTRYLNSGYDRNGHKFWFWDTVKPGDRFCNLKASKKGRVVTRKGRKKLCNNDVIFTNKTPKGIKVKTKVLLVTSLEVLRKVTTTTQETTTSGSETVTITTPVDTPPQIMLTGSPAHLYKGGSAIGWIEASDADGDVFNVTVNSVGLTDSGRPTAHVAGFMPSDVRWDKTPCPAGTKCYRYTVWADEVGTAQIVATVSTAKQDVFAYAEFPVYADEF